MNLAPLFHKTDSFLPAPRANNSTTPPEPTASRLPDAVLLRASLDGDKAAWDHLVEKYARLVYWIAYRRLPSLEDATQVFRRVFEILLETLPYYRDIESLAVVLTVLTRTEVKRLVNTNGDPTAAQVHPMESFNQSPDDKAQEEREALVCALWQLDPFLQGFALACLMEPAPTEEELSAKFTMPLEKVRQTRARCVQDLQFHLATLPDHFTRLQQAPMAFPKRLATSRTFLNSLPYYETAETGSRRACGLLSWLGCLK